MDTNLTFPSLAALPNPASAAAPGIEPPGVVPLKPPSLALRGADFANLLSSMLVDPQRQGLAAAGLAEAGLQAVPLGPQIELITTAKPLPDTGSLMAFARSQGLDESTLAALFGDMAAPTPAGVGGLAAATATFATSATAGKVGVAYILSGQVVSADVPPASAPMPALVGAIGAKPVATLDASTSSPVPAAHFLTGQILSISLPPAPATVLPPAPATVLPPASSSLPLVIDVDAKLVTAKEAIQAAPVATAYFLSDRAPTATSSSASVTTPAFVAAVEVALQSPAASHQNTLSAAGAAGAAGAVKPEASQDVMADALRVELLLPREVVTALTRRLAGLTGSAQAQAWGKLTGNAVGSASVSQAALDLRQFFAPVGASVDAVDATPAIETLTSVTKVAGMGAATTLPVDDGRKASAPQTLQPEAVSPSMAGQRAENYQLLADRLGQALGQRLQAQIERGEWKVQMRLDPVSLGRIDLELQMRSGGLDAVFRSDNPMTRELISQGLPKLRESLSDSGTAVANVWVNGDSARQSGGNPTPGKTPAKRTPNDSDVDVAAVSSLAAVPLSGARQGGTSGTWDVLA